MKIHQSIKVRLTFNYLIAVAVLLLILNVTAYVLLSSHLFGNLDSHLRTRMTEIQDCIKPSGNGFTFDEYTSELVLIYDASGNLVQSMGPNIAYSNIDGLVQRTLVGQSSYITDTIQNGHELRFYAAPTALSSNTCIAIILGTSTDEVKANLGLFMAILGISSIMVLLLSGASGLFLANRALKPVEKMTNAAKQISETDLSQRIQVNSRDELGHLASTFNGMVERLEMAFKRQRQFTSDASHELRTPLSIIQAEATVALKKERTPIEYRESLNLVSQEVSYMKGIIDQLLFLARSDSGKEVYTFEVFSIKDLLEELSTQVKTLFVENGLNLHMGPVPDLVVKGDKAKLRQAVLNLLENAIKCTPAEGNISIKAAAQNKTAVISVSDTGTGIAPEHIPHIFERFFRVDKPRSGNQSSGLGLAIVKTIALAHKGKVEVESEIDRGTVFRISIPLVELAGSN
jgi:heavy metal sensor kinase